MKHICIFKGLSRQGYAESVIAQKIGINPYFLKDIRPQAEKVKESDIFSFFNKLLMTDSKLKSSPLSCNAVIEGLVLDICRN